MSASEILYWQDFFSIYGFERDREDSKHAQLCTLYINSHLGKGRTPAEFEDFLPDYLGTKNKVSATEKSPKQENKFSQLVSEIRSIKRFAKRGK